MPVEFLLEWSFERTKFTRETPLFGVNKSLVLRHYSFVICLVVTDLALIPKFFFGFVRRSMSSKSTFVDKLLLANQAFKSSTFLMFGQNMSLDISFQNRGVIAMFTFVKCLLISLTQIFVNRCHVTSKIDLKAKCPLTNVASVVCNF